MYAERYAALNETALYRARLVSNVVGVVAPVSTAMCCLRSLESAASAFSQPRLAATGEQARLAGVGLSACDTAWGGTIACLPHWPPQRHQRRSRAGGGPRESTQCPSRGSMVGGEVIQPIGAVPVGSLCLLQHVRFCSSLSLILAG